VQKERAKPSIVDAGNLESLRHMAEVPRNESRGFPSLVPFVAFIMLGLGLRPSGKDNGATELGFFTKDECHWYSDAGALVPIKRL